MSIDSLKTQTFLLSPWNTRSSQAPSVRISDAESKDGSRAESVLKDEGFVSFVALLF